MSYSMPDVSLARLDSCPDADGRAPLAAFAFPGGYPLVYLCTDGACLCPSCANEEDREAYNDDDDIAIDAPVVSFFANYEDVIYCDGCYAAMMGAYVEEEAIELNTATETGGAL